MQGIEHTFYLHVISKHISFDIHWVKPIVAYLYIGLLTKDLIQIIRQAALSLSEEIAFQNM